MHPVEYLSQKKMLPIYSCMYLGTEATQLISSSVGMLWVLPRSK